jgi:hypothetical protein
MSADLADGAAGVDGVDGFDGADQFLAASAMHPGLADDDHRARLAERFRAAGRVRIAPVLAPGLAAELAPLLVRMPLLAQRDHREDAVWWRCAIQLPAAPDPQYPECMYRLTRFLDEDLPALASAVLGRRVVSAAPSWLDLRVVRKGSYVDGGDSFAPAGGVDYLLGLTGAAWPAAWGGHLALDPAVDDDAADPRAGDDRGAVGWDTLVLFSRAQWRIPLVARHVEGLFLRGMLAPEDR